jgi:hypothetical protein
MSDVSVVYRPGPAGQPSEPSGHTLLLPTAHKRSRRKEIIAPLALAILGLALLMGAFKLYPTTTERPTPAFTHLYISSASRLEGIIYRVDPVGHGKAMMTIELRLAGNLPPGGAFAGVAVSSPPGMTFVDCSGPSCKEHSRNIGLTFKRNGGAITALAAFPLKTHNVGVNYNSVTASAAIPEIVYQAHGKPTLYVGYHIPSASTYDWASYPPFSTDGYNTVWDEAVAPGDTIARAAVGIDHAAQAKDDNKIFLAGALFALAGGAILAAVPEALHARDWAALRHLGDAARWSQRGSVPKG